MLTEDRVRAIVREELARRPRRVADTAWYLRDAEVVAWLAGLPPGTRGTATELLALYASAHGGAVGRWTVGALGRRLARTAGVAHRWDRVGRSVYVVG